MEAAGEAAAELLPAPRFERVRSFSISLGSRWNFGLWGGGNEVLDDMGGGGVLSTILAVASFFFSVSFFLFFSLSGLPFCVFFVFLFFLGGSSEINVMRL